MSAKRSRLIGLSALASVLILSFAVQQILAELRHVQPASPQHSLLLDQLQQLLDEEENS